MVNSWKNRMGEFTKGPVLGAFWRLCQLLPWQTKRIFVKCDQPPEKPYSAPFCSPFAGQKKLLINCDSVMEKAKYGKMRQVNAVNGSQMVVKIGVVYYR